MIKRWKVKVFILSFLVHMLCEIGLTSEFTTAAFYKPLVLADGRPVKDLKFSSMQIVLLAISVGYFVLGPTLEYTRRSDLILFILVAGYGLINTGVSIAS